MRGNDSNEEVEIALVLRLRGGSGMKKMEEEYKSIRS